MEHKLAGTRAQTHSPRAQQIYTKIFGIRAHSHVGSKLWHPRTHGRLFRARGAYVRFPASHPFAPESARSETHPSGQPLSMSSKCLPNRPGAEESGRLAPSLSSRQSAIQPTRLDNAVGRAMSLPAILSGVRPSGRPFDKTFRQLEIRQRAAQSARWYGIAPPRRCM